MKFEQIENLNLNKLVDLHVRSGEYETREDYLAHCVRKDLGIEKVEAPKIAPAPTPKTSAAFRDSAPASAQKTVASGPKPTQRK